MIAELKEKQAKEIEKQNANASLSASSSREYNRGTVEINSIIDEFHYQKEDAILKYASWQELSIPVGDLEVNDGALIPGLFSSLTSRHMTSRDPGSGR